MDSQDVNERRQNANVESMGGRNFARVDVPACAKETSSSLEPTVKCAQETPSGSHSKQFSARTQNLLVDAQSVGSSNLLETIMKTDWPDSEEEYVPSDDPYANQSDGILDSDEADDQSSECQSFDANTTLVVMDKGSQDTLSEKSQTNIIQQAQQSKNDFHSPSKLQGSSEHDDEIHRDSTSSPTWLQRRQQLLNNPQQKPSSSTAYSTSELHQKRIGSAAVHGNDPSDRVSKSTVASTLQVSTSGQEQETTLQQSIQHPDPTENASLIPQATDSSDARMPSESSMLSSASSLSGHTRSNVQLVHQRNGAFNAMDGRENSNDAMNSGLQAGTFDHLSTSQDGRGWSSAASTVSNRSGRRRRRLRPPNISTRTRAKHSLAHIAIEELEKPLDGLLEENDEYEIDVAYANFLESLHLGPREGGYGADILHPNHHGSFIHSNDDEDDSDLDFQPDLDDDDDDETDDYADNIQISQREIESLLREPLEEPLAVGVNVLQPMRSKVEIGSPYWTKYHPDITHRQYIKIQSQMRRMLATLLRLFLKSSQHLELKDAFFRVCRMLLRTRDFHTEAARARHRAMQAVSSPEGFFTKLEQKSGTEHGDGFCGHIATGASRQDIYRNISLGGVAATPQQVLRGQLLGRHEAFVTEKVSPFSDIVRTINEVFMSAHRLGEMRRTFYEDSSTAQQNDYLQPAGQTLGQVHKADKYPTVTTQTVHIIRFIHDAYPDFYEEILNLPFWTASVTISQVQPSPNLDGTLQGTNAPSKPASTQCPQIASTKTKMVTGKAILSKRFNMHLEDLPGPTWRRLFFQRQKSIFSLAENELIYIGLCRHSHDNKGSIVATTLIDKNLQQLRNRFKNARKAKAQMHDLGRYAICRFKFPGTASAAATAAAALVSNGSDTLIANSASHVVTADQSFGHQHVQPGDIIPTEANALTRIEWSPAEDAALEFAVKNVGLEWDIINYSYLPHRGPTQLRRRWMELHNFSVRNFRRREQRYFEKATREKRQNDPVGSTAKHEGGDSASKSMNSTSSQTLTSGTSNVQTSKRHRGLNARDLRGAVHRSWLCQRLQRYPLGLVLFPPSSGSDESEEEGINQGSDAHGPDKQSILESQVGIDRADVQHARPLTKKNEPTGVDAMLTCHMYHARRKHYLHRMQRRYPARRLPQPFAVSIGIPDGETNVYDKDFGADSDTTDDYSLDDSSDSEGSLEAATAVADPASNAAAATATSGSASHAAVATGTSGSASNVAVATRINETLNATSPPTAIRHDQLQTEGQQSQTFEPTEVVSAHIGPNKTSSPKQLTRVELPEVATITSSMQENGLKATNDQQNPVITPIVTSTTQNASVSQLSASHSSSTAMNKGTAQNARVPIKRKATDNYESSPSVHVSHITTASLISEIRSPDSTSPSLATTKAGNLIASVPPSGGSDTSRKPAITSSQVISITAQLAPEETTTIELPQKPKFTRDEDRTILHACRAATGRKDAIFWQALSGTDEGQVNKPHLLIKQRFQFLSKLFKRRKKEKNTSESGRRK